jgi:dolichol-phosphate mannosyltransferase
MNVFVILPAFNEEKGLPQVLKTIQQVKKKTSDSFRVVVVDDGSKDRTSDVARSFQAQMDLHLITFPKNQGVAEVFKQGFLYACETSMNPHQDVAVVLDSDNTQDPFVMLSMIEKIKSGEDIVIASRFKGEGKMIGCPFTRYLFSLGISWILQAIVRLPGIKDYSTFYRAYRVSILKDGFEQYGDTLLEGKGFSVAAGLLMKLGNITPRLTEVPLILRYDLKGGASGNKIMRTITGYLQLITQYLRTQGFKSLRRIPATKA